MFNTPYFKVTRAGNHPVMTGKITVSAALPAGSPVLVGAGSSQTGLHDDNTTLVPLPDGSEGRLLFTTRKVLASTVTEVPLENIVWDNEPVTPVLSGGYLDAVHVEEIEAEGSDYLFLTASDGQEITGSTAAGTRLTLKDGLWAVIDTVASQAVHGRLIKQLTPYTSGNVRIAIEVFANGTFDKVV